MWIKNQTIVWNSIVLQVPLQLRCSIARFVTSVRVPCLLSSNACYATSTSASVVPVSKNRGWQFPELKLRLSSHNGNAWRASPTLKSNAVFVHPSSSLFNYSSKVVNLHFIFLKSEFIIIVLFVTHFVSNLLYFTLLIFV